jgi:pilus assembly protein CpaF
MLSLTDIFKAQSKYGVNNNITAEGESVSYEVYLIGCRRMLTDKTPVDYYGWDVKRQNDFTDNLIVTYVRNNLKLVEGFLDANGDLEQDELINRLRIDIVDFGILREALEDDTIQEIQINDCKTIWVVRSGKSELFVDKNGKPYQFVSDDELHATIDRLIYNPNGSTPRMTKTNPLLNTRTAGKGYRLSAVNGTAITPDSTVGFDFPCTSVTIRKYAPSMLTFTDFERFGSICPEASNFLRMCGKANIRLACVGPTSSGKTTLLNAVCWEVDPDLRLILIQNPTEIMIYKRSEENGANSRNVLHWEAQDLTPEAAKDPTTPTMANEIAHTLRNTPDVIVPGEVRTPDEFYQMNRALKTGHRVLTTWHALDGADAIDRASTELSTIGGNPLDHARSMANSFDIIVSQQKLGDGRRKVMKIEYLTGRLIDGRAETETLFEFKLTGETEKDPETGRVKEIFGYFQQVSPLNDNLVQAFYSVGVTKEEIEMYVNPPKILPDRSNLKSQEDNEKRRFEAMARLHGTQAKEDESESLSFL